MSMLVNLSILNAAIILGAPLLLREDFFLTPLKYITTAAVANILFCLAQIRSDFRQSLDDSIKALIIGTGIFYGIALLYGALILRSITQCLAWSLWMSSLTLLPITLTLGPLYYHSDEWLRLFRHLHPLRPSETLLLGSVISLLLANWIACVVIPLDWGRIWQQWPIPNVLAGTTIHSLVSIILSLAISMGKGSGVRARKIPMVEVELPARTSSHRTSPTRKGASRSVSPVKRVTISPKKTYIEPINETPKRRTRSRSPTSSGSKKKRGSRSVSPSVTTKSLSKASPRLRRSPRKRTN